MPLTSPPVALPAMGIWNGFGWSGGFRVAFCSGGHEEGVGEGTFFHFLFVEGLAQVVLIYFRPRVITSETPSPLLSLLPFIMMASWNYFVGFGEYHHWGHQSHVGLRWERVALAVIESGGFCQWEDGTVTQSTVIRARSELSRVCL